MDFGIRRGLSLNSRGDEAANGRLTGIARTFSRVVLGKNTYHSAYTSLSRSATHNQPPKTRMPTKTRMPRERSWHCRLRSQKRERHKTLLDSAQNYNAT